MELEEPLPSDCCGSGCSPCVFDIYRQREQGTDTNIKCNDSLRTDLLSKTRFKRFKLLRKFQISECVFEFRFQPVQNDVLNSNEEIEISGILPYNMGQHLFLRCFVSEVERGEMVCTNPEILESKNTNRSKNKDDVKFIIRAYTPITLATEENHCCFNIFVKLYEYSITSVYLRKSLIGDILYWRGPYGTFQYKTNSFHHVLMLSVGTGLAPMISVIKSILNNELDESIVHLKCGFKSIDHIIYRNNLKEMTHFWNFSLEYYFSEIRESNNNPQFGEHIINKKIDKNAVQEYMSNKIPEEVFILLCGTDTFTYEMRNIISDLHVNINTNVHTF